MEIKKRLAEEINKMLTPMRQRRTEFESKPEEIERILKEGTVRAREVARETMKKVKKVMKIDYFP